MDFGVVSSLLTQFEEYILSFEDDLSSLSQEQAKLIGLKPRSLAGKIPALLQLRSKKASVAYSTDLNVLLWDKLVERFPYPTYQGQRLSIGRHFVKAYYSRRVPRSTLPPTSRHSVRKELLISGKTPRDSLELATYLLLPSMSISQKRC